MISAFADAVRGAHYASIILLFGCFVFQLAVAEPALRTARAGAAERRQLEGFLRAVAAASLQSGLLTGIVWLWLNAADMSGETLGAAFSWQLFGTVLGDTGFGVLWQFRGAVAILLGALLAIPLLVRRTGKTPAVRLACATAGVLLSGLILASLALTGHAVDNSGTARVWHLGADLLHLLAAGGWLGSLPPLVFVLWQAREPGALNQLRIAQAATSRFSTLGLVTVATLIVTGSINTWYLVGSVPALVGTPYGRVLLVKLALFAGMLALAAVNRLKLTPLLLAVPADPIGMPHPVRRLCRSVMVETGLAILLLLAVGSLVHLIPGAHSDAVWPFPVTLDIDGVTDLSSARLRAPRRCRLRYSRPYRCGDFAAAVALAVCRGVDRCGCGDRGLRLGPVRHRSLSDELCSFAGPLRQPVDCSRHVGLCRELCRLSRPLWLWGRPGCRIAAGPAGRFDRGAPLPPRRGDVVLVGQPWRGRQRDARFCRSAERDPAMGCNHFPARPGRCRTRQIHGCGRRTTGGLRRPRLRLPDRPCSSGDAHAAA